MRTVPTARRMAGALLLVLLAPAARAGEGAAAEAQPRAEAPAPRQPPASRKPPPMVLVVPLGVGLLLPLTLPTTMPRARTADEKKAAPAAEPANANVVAPEEAR